MDLGLEIKQTQNLSPQMMQAMEILQMGSQELLEYLEETLQENPVLEREESREESGSGNEEDDLLRRKLEWLESTDVQNRTYHLEDSEDGDPLERYGGEDARDETLEYYLQSQLPGDLPQELRRVVDYVIESLNSSGYLEEPARDVACHLGVDGALAAEAVSLVQALEPAGVAAANLAECLQLQLARRGETGLPFVIAGQYLEEVGKGHYMLIARETGATREEVAKACDALRSLNPRPGSGFSSRDHLSYITPDLVVVNFQDHFELLANDYFFPTLRVSSYYHDLMKTTSDEQVKDYLTGKLRQARWVVRSVEQRRSTLISCAECLLDLQEDFFRHGPGHLRPMSLSDIAGRLGVHESTVSRAVKDKYLQCAHGVFPLGYFFTRALGKSDGEKSGAVSPDNAKAELKKLIDGENTKKPLSDQKLSELLAAKGVELSRRTVAKYREELGIPATSGRRTF